MKLTVLTAIIGLAFLGVIFELVRRRQLREKYAMLWLAIGLIVVPLGFFPRTLDRISVAIGVASGASLVLFLGLTVLLLICIHLSWEVSRLEEETRSLAEDLALLRTALRQPAFSTARRQETQAQETQAAESATADSGPGKQGL